MAYNKSIFRTMSSEDFLCLVKSSSSVSDMLRKYNYSATSGTMQKIIKNRIIEEKIDTSHFIIRGELHPQSGKPKHKLEDILVENSAYANISCLKNRLIKSGMLEYKCESCGNTGEWNGKPLVLQLEHKNGKHTDHRLENLCFLCPNCHSQTDTFAGKNADKTKIWYNQS